MEFLDTFLPTFLANLLALVPFGLFLAWLNRETRMRLAKFGSVVDPTVRTTKRPS